MTVGNKKKHQSIVEAIVQAEKETTSEIHVHLSQRWVEKDPYQSALAIFEKHGLFRTSQRNAVLLYVNLRKKQLAIYGDSGIHSQVGQAYWDQFAHHLRDHLKLLPYDQAIAQSISEIAQVLKRLYPVSPSSSNPNQLKDEVTED